MNRTRSEGRFEQNSISSEDRKKKKRNGNGERQANVWI